MSALHALDLWLCNHVHYNIHQQLDDEEFAYSLRKRLDPRLMKYLEEKPMIKSGSTPRPELLLNSDELEILASRVATTPVMVPKKWSSPLGLQPRITLATGEICGELVRSDGEDWSREAVEFAAELEAEGLSLQDGIEIIDRWVSKLRWYLRAIIDKRALLPAPEGSFPTPTNPDPAVPKSQERAASDAQSPQAALPQDRERDDVETQEAIQAGPGEELGESLKNDIAEIKSQLAGLAAERMNQQPNLGDKDWYTVKEVKEITGLSEYTLRQACNTQRLSEDHCRKGEDGKWRISHEGLTLLQNQGLPPKNH